MVQDGPPPGGFPSVRYGRRLPTTGPTGPTLFLVSGAVMAYGFYLVSLHVFPAPGMMKVMTSVSCPPAVMAIRGIEVVVKNVSPSR